MMGPIKGKPVSPSRFTPFTPIKVLDELDGPRLFTFHDHEDELCLAMWFDENRERVRYLIVPFSEPLVKRLEAGRLSLREALEQPRLWVLDVSQQGEPIAAMRADLDNLPAEELPSVNSHLSPR